MTLDHEEVVRALHIERMKVAQLATIVKMLYDRQALLGPCQYCSCHALCSILICLIQYLSFPQTFSTQGSQTAVMRSRLLWICQVIAWCPHAPILVDVGDSRQRRRQPHDRVEEPEQTLSTKHGNLYKNQTRQGSKDSRLLIGRVLLGILPLLREQIPLESLPIHPSYYLSFK